MNPSYPDWREQDLLQRAQEIGIKNCSTMTKRKFIRALCKSQKEISHELFFPDGDKDRIDGLAGSNGDVHAGRASAVAAQEVTPGALRERYEIPEVTFPPQRSPGAFAVQSLYYLLDYLASGLAVSRTGSLCGSSYRLPGCELGNVLV